MLLKKYYITVNITPIKILFYLKFQIVLKLVGKELIIEIAE